MLFFADGEMATIKNLLLNIFFPSSPNDLKLLQFFFTCMGRFVGIFELIHIYLGIVKSFQTLHVHMNMPAETDTKLAKIRLEIMNTLRE